MKIERNIGVSPLRGRTISYRLAGSTGSGITDHQAYREVLARLHQLEAAGKDRDYTPEEAREVEDCCDSLQMIRADNPNIDDMCSGDQSRIQAALKRSRSNNRGLHPLALGSQYRGAGSGTGPSRRFSFSQESDYENALRAIGPNESFADAVGYDGPAFEGDIGDYLRGIALGDWRGNDQLQSIAVGTGSAGGFLVPSPLSNQIIDTARNKSRVIQAGARVIPMPSNTLDIAKVTGDPNSSWKAENEVIVPSDMTFGRIQLRAKTLTALVKMSVEAFEDCMNIGELVNNTLGEVLALELDRAALYGSGAGSEPTGLLNISGVGEVDMGGNGAALTSYAPFANAITDIMTANGPGPEGLAAIFSPRVWGELENLVDGDDNPLRAPRSYEHLRKYVTNQVSVTSEHGNADNASEIFVGDWTQLLWGVKTELQIETSRVASDSAGSAFENLQVWVRAYLRADIHLARPGFFSVVKGVIPPSA